MGLYENIKTLCDRSNIAVTRLESELGFARGSIGKLRSQKSMKADRLDKRGYTELFLPFFAYLCGFLRF